MMIRHVGAVAAEVMAPLAASRAVPPNAADGDKRKADKSRDHSGIKTKPARLQEAQRRSSGGNKSLSFDDSVHHPEARGSSEPPPGPDATGSVPALLLAHVQPEVPEEEQATREYEEHQFDEYDDTAEYLAHGILTSYYIKEMAREARRF